MGKKFVRAIFPGSFDPITNGHLDVINRGIKLFDELIIAVGRSPVKNQLFTPEERVEMIAELIADMPGILVESFEGLTVEYAAKKKADDEAKKTKDELTETKSTTDNSGAGATTKPKTEKRSDYAFANKVPGKEGFVFSPYNQKVVDVRGMPSGTLVQDPTYPVAEKKFFRVP